MRKKVTIVGGGNVGATTAHWLAAAELADVVLVDVLEGIPQGKGLDLLEAMPIAKRDVSILGTQNYEDTANSDVVIITAGIARKPGMSRDDLLNTNYKIMSQVVGNAVKYSPNCILIVVSNPLDAMAQTAFAERLLPQSRDRYGGRAGFGPLPYLHRARAEGERRKRKHIRPGRARRYDGAAPTVFDRGGYPVAGTDGAGDN